MLYAPIHLLNVSQLHPRTSINNEQRGVVQSSTLSGVQRESIEVGRAVYPFRLALSEHIGSNFYSLDVFSPHIIGVGNDPDQARRDFEGQLHTAFQEISGTLDFDRNQQQSKLWEVFSRVIDIQAYDSRRTVVHKQLGQIISVPRAGSIRVKWASGASQDIEVSKAAPEFVALRVGQWFEAGVRKAYLTDQVIFLEYVSPIRAPEYSPAERLTFWRTAEKPGT